MHLSTLEFKPINLELHQELCIQFRADSFVCSFGSPDRFYQEDASGARYLQWLKHRMTQIPNSCVHVWKGEQIIGQIEMQRWRHNPEAGYVNLFYLTPDCRGQGLGQQLDRYAANFFKQLSCKTARLSVTPTNLGAMRFYLKHAWIDLGQREDDPEVHYLEKVYETDD